MALDPVAGGLISTGINAAASFGVGAMNQHYAEQNALQAYRLGQKAQVNAAGNMVEGFKRAGLSPALAAGANFSAAGGISGQGGNTPAPQAADLAAAANLQKQGELVDAQIEKTNAETQSVKNQNQAWKDENGASQEFGQVMAQRMVNSKWFNHLLPDTRKTLESLANGENLMSIGAYKALLRTIEAQANLSNAEVGQLNNFYQAAVLHDKLNDKDVIEADVKRGLAEFNLTNAQVSQLAALIMKHQEEVEELAARGQLERTQVAQIFANDVNLMAMEGEWKQLLKVKGMKAFDGIVEGLTYAIPFVGASKALGGVGKFVGKFGTSGRTGKDGRAYSKSTLGRLDSHVNPSGWQNVSDPKFREHMAKQFDRQRNESLEGQRIRESRKNWDGKPSYWHDFPDTRF